MHDHRPNSAAWRRATQAKEEARQLRQQAEVFRTRFRKGGSSEYLEIAARLENDASRKETEAALQVWPAWGRRLLPEKTLEFELELELEPSSHDWDEEACEEEDRCAAG